MPFQFNRNRIFRRKACNFINQFKRDFEAKSWKDFRDFERNGRIKKAKRLDWDEDQSDKGNVKFLKFIQGFINDRWIVSSRNSRRF